MCIYIHTYINIYIHTYALLHKIFTVQSVENLNNRNPLMFAADFLKVALKISFSSWRRAGLEILVNKFWQKCSVQKIQLFKEKLI